MGLSIITSLLLALRLFPSGALAAPSAPAAAAAASPQLAERAAASSWWLPNLQHQGTVAFGAAGYQVFRSVTDFGAAGDGVTDDTSAINAAIAAGNRCGQGCDSSTTTPAIVFFPPGTYLVSGPIIQLYMTQLIGDAVNPPTLKASAGFSGMAVIDSDPYVNGVNFYTNQNNFYRQVRNFVIDLTAQPPTTGTGIHWQVAQATSLQNIVFNMRTDGGTSNAQQGIFMDNGSGGFMSDLTFNGGKYGAFLGSQQFTTRNMTFNGCQTAIYMNWNWLWTFSGLSINNCGVGIDMSNGGPSAQTVGSVVVMDSTIANTPVGILTAFSPSAAQTNGTLIIDNVDMSANVPAAVSDAGSNSVVLNGNAKVGSFLQGRSYSTSTVGHGLSVQGSQTTVTKPAALLDSTGRVFTRSKPQYQGVSASSFISVKSKGAKGDGATDDTAAIQAALNAAGANDIVFFDHGAYVVTNTITVPKDIKIVGEIWPIIMAGGTAFNNQASPKAVFQVGQPGDVGNVEMQDLVFETLGPQPGAIMVEWNVAGTSPGQAAMWDVHFRIGGSAGTQLQSGTCTKNPSVTAPANPACMGAFLLLHVTAQGSAYLENVWAWVADHELDNSDHSQINIFNGRGMLIEATNGTWLWGTASEHSVLYNYQLAGASNVFIGLAQTETAYFQGNPDANTPFTTNTNFLDPDFATLCAGQPASCARTFGLRVTGSSGVLVYGAGLYSFFDNYDQTCLATESCQTQMVDIESSGVTFFGLSTKAAVSMVNVDGQSAALDADNRNNFCATLGSFFAQAS